MNLKLLTRRRKNKDKPDDLLFVFRSNAIYSSALSTLSAGDWLQDSIIGFYYDYLEEIYHLENSKIFLFQPSVIHLIANTSDLNDARDSLPKEIQNKDYLFFPTNNGDIFNTGGSHWSLLVYDRPNNTFRYYDSMCNSNLYSTKIMVERMCILLDKPKTNLIIEKCEQQQNDFDCGVFILLYTKVLTQRLLSVLYPTGFLLNHVNGSSRKSSSSSTDKSSVSSQLSTLESQAESSISDTTNNDELWSIETLDTTPAKKRKKISKIISKYIKSNRLIIP